MKLQLNQVRRDCEKFGMPLIIWAYPRGEAVKAKGGVESLYAVDYASRLALELGADVRGHGFFGAVGLGEGLAVMCQLGCAGGVVPEGVNGVGEAL